MQVLKQAWRMMLRDQRAGELNFLIVSIIVAVAALASVGFFVERMRTGLNRDAHQLLGADVVVSADQPIGAQWLAEAEKRGLLTAQTLSFPSMASAGVDAQWHTKLVAVKAVSTGYPLRGHLKTSLSLDGTGEIETTVPKHGELWADAAVLRGLQLGVGGHVKLGELELTVTKVIVNEPDRGAGFMNFAPRVMLSVDDIPATHLVQDNSRVGYRLQVASNPSSDAAENFKSWIEADTKQSNVRGTRVESLQSGNPEMRATLDRAERFLSLVGVLSAMLAAVAIAMAARRFMLRHIDACAMLRCLGMRESEVLAMYLAEFLMLGVFASIAGVLVGLGAHYVLVNYLGKLVATDIPPPSILPGVKAFATGLVLLLGFAIPPVLQLRNVPHNRVIRREQDAPQMMTLASYVLGISAFVGLVLWQAQDLKLGALSAAGFIGGFVVFALVAYVCLRGMRALRHRVSNTALRFAITSLLRRTGASVVQIVSLALGLMALLLLTVTRGELVSGWRQSTPADAPDHFVINIQPDQKRGVEQVLTAQGVVKPNLYPMIRGRLVAVNGAPVTATTYQDGRARGLVEREFNLSAMQILPASNTVVAGKWFDDTRPEASVEEGIAKTLNLKTGDLIKFDVAGETVEAPITSVRKLDWGSMRVNFFVILNPAAVKKLPETYITAFRAPKTTPGLPSTIQTTSAPPDIESLLTRDYPNLTVIDVSSILAQLQSVLDQVTTAVEFLFLFTLVSGVLVLYAALVSSQDERMRESAILRALGATSSQLQGAQRLEFLITGGLAGVLAASGAALVGWSLAHYVFQFAWNFSPWVWLIGSTVGAGCAYMGGQVGLRRVLSTPPLQSLRGTL